MREGPDIASIAALIGDPARAAMLSALMSGLALSAGELAREAGITPQTASTHLAQLREAELILVEVQGRHRYFRLNGPDVACALESLIDLANRMGKLRTRPGPRDQAMRKARICYDHLAGEMGVRLYAALMEQGHFIATQEGLGLSQKGRSRFLAEGIDIPELEKRSRSLCSTCLDWSERRHHLAGKMGAALLNLFMARGWARRDGASRAILFSPAGERAFEAFAGEARPVAVGRS